MMVRIVVPYKLNCLVHESDIGGDPDSRRDMQALEENKVLAASLFNYSIYITGGKKQLQPVIFKQQHEDMSPSIDEELNKLLNE